MYILVKYMQNFRIKIELSDEFFVIKLCDFLSSQGSKIGT